MDRVCGTTTIAHHHEGYWGAGGVVTPGRPRLGAVGLIDPRIAAKVLGNPYGIRTRAATLRGWSEPSNPLQSVTFS